MKFLGLCRTAIALSLFAAVGFAQEKETTTVQMNVANGGGDSGIEVRVGSTKVGRLTVGNTGDWNAYQSKSLTLSAPQSGVQNVKLVFVNGNVNVDSFTFSAATPQTASPTAKRPVAPAAPPKSQGYKPRIINTTDLGADPDDEQSMVRFLVCSNEFHVEGLIVATGCWRKSQSNTGMLDRIVNAYGQAYDNLKVHADGYPSPEYLRCISVMGQRGYGMGDVGDGKDSPGSELIIAAVDKDDPRPVWVTGWGGVNNVAQAIWKVKNTRSEAELTKFISKLRVFDILGQDDAGAIKRWSQGYNNDFEARMDWTMTRDYSKPNHHPVAVVNGDTTRQVLEMSAAAGSSVTLSAAGSSDPDGDSLAYSWSFYKEPSSYSGSVSVKDSSSASATVAVPSNAGGKAIHIVLEIHDDGSPNLYAYRRVIINVK